MYLEFYNNNGSRSVRIVRASYEPNKNGIMTSKKKVVKFLGPVHKFDDGLPDSLYVRIVVSGTKNFLW